MAKQQNRTRDNNVFADMGLPDAEELLAKAKLSHAVIAEIQNRKLTQREAAEILGTSQAKISDIVHGHLEKFSLERLMKMLLAFDKDVHIVCAPKARGHRHGSLTVEARP